MSSPTSINITKNRRNWNFKQKTQGNDSGAERKQTEHLEDLTVSFATEKICFQMINTVFPAPKWLSTTTD